MIKFFADDKLKIFYAQISKAGCSSIKYELFIRPNLENNDGSIFFNDYVEVHKNAKQFCCKWNKKKYKNYFKFTVVRDPLKRFISAYKNKIKVRNRDTLQRIRMDESDEEKTQDINVFLSYINERSAQRDGHLQTQKSLLPKIKYLDFVGNIENMGEVEQALSEKTGKKISFPVINKSADYSPAIFDMEKFYYLYRKDYKMLKNFYTPPRINRLRYIWIYLKQKPIYVIEICKDLARVLNPSSLYILADKLIGKIGQLIKSKNENLYFKLKKILCIKYFG